MAAGNLQYKEQGLRVDRRFYIGTATIVAGQPFCYQEASGTASVTKGFGFDIEFPNTANVRGFAGIAHESAVGITGPAYIDIVVPRPGDILQVLVSGDADIALGEVLKLNSDVPTALNLGAFDLLLAVSSSGSVDATDLNPQILAAINEAQCMAIGVSVASDADERTLAWVKFIK